MSEETAIVLWGFEFEWRENGSFPLRFRKHGGCEHDWTMLGYDHPLVAAVRDVVPPPDQETVEHQVRHIVGEFLRKWGYRQGMNNPGNVVQTGDLYRALHAAGLLIDSDQNGRNDLLMVKEKLNDRPDDPSGSGGE